MKTLIYLSTTLLFIGCGLMSKISYGQTNGKELFQQYTCNSCHTINKGKLIGPELANISDKRSRSWLIDFIQSPQTMIQNGDSIAVSLYEQYNKVMMPENNISASEIDAILKYIEKNSNEATAETSQQAQKKTTFTAKNIKAGNILFTGKIRFFNEGPSCITCHNISTQNKFNGGNIAIDLANSYEKLGENGIKAILKNPSFPVMKAAYQNKPLLDAEIHNLTAYLKEVSATQQTKQKPALSVTYKLLLAGIAGTGLFIFIISMIWRKRKRRGIHDKLFNRQLKTN